MKDVLETLNSLDMDVLNRIHRVLADRVKSDFYQYKDRRAVQRIVAHTAAKDIWSLGFCITNGLPTKDLDKILISQNKEKTSDADCTIDDSDTSQRVMNHVLELLQTVNTLDEKVRTIQTQIVVLQRDNQLLHIQLAENARSIETSVESDETVHSTSPIQIQSPAETPKRIRMRERNWSNI